MRDATEPSPARQLSTAKTAAPPSPRHFTIQDEARVVRVQTLVRRRLARKRGEAAAGEHYRKCWDALSGFAYYCNLRTGAASWHKPALLGAHDADWIDLAAADAAAALEAQPAAVETAAVWRYKSRRSSSNADRIENDADSTSVPPRSASQPTEPPTNAAMIAQWRQRFDDGVAFQQQCAQEKLALMQKHRRKIARAMQRWDRQLLSDKQQRRAERLACLKSANQQHLQDLYAGKAKQNVETIREAAMRGHVGRVRELLESGFSADAESAMGLTPLLAACQNGQLEAVKILLASGADVNHAHVKTGRTALMEAAARTNAEIVKELLRYGAQLYVADAHGERVFDGMNDAGIRAIVTMACDVWSADNAPLFPTEFRNATLALALVAKRQRESWLRRTEATRREVLATRASLQRLLAEAKVRYDEDKRTCHAQITIMKKLETLEAADSRYDAERCRLLRLAQDALDSLCSARQPRYLTESIAQTILSYCGRHWFEAADSRAEPRRRRRRREHSHESSVRPTKLRDPPDKLSTELLDEWNAFEARLRSHCKALRDVETQERADVESGVARALDGTSRATLDICVVEAEHLALRDPRTGEAASELSWRASSESDLNDTHAFATDVRLDERNPTWELSHRMTAVPSIHAEVRVHVVDHKRQEVAGEVAIALRSLLDQREHDEWHVLPPTLRQQLVERGTAARRHAARIRLRLQFTHTKAIVLTCELQQLLKLRDALVQQKRECIQRAINERLDKMAPTTMGSDAATKLADAQTRLAAVERQVADLQSVARVKAHLQDAKLSSAYLKTAPSNYYSWSLSQRAAFLGCNVPHLCKSIIVENTACTNAGTDDARNSRFYCVVLQYNSKLNAEQLMRFVRSLIPESERPGRKHFNFQHAPGHVSEELTGFAHNGVAPFGMTTQIPVIVSGEVAALEPPFIWLGGGAESVKLRIGVQQLVQGLSAFVADKNLTTLRDDL